MIKLVYDPNSVINAKNNFKTYNEHIIECLEKINTEFQEIDKVLNTPKAQEVIPVYLEEFSNDLTFLNTMKDSFDQTFDNINEEYQAHVEYMRKMVGKDYEAK